MSLTVTDLSSLDARPSYLHTRFIDHVSPGCLQGLQNFEGDMVNVCFLNTALQMLMHCPLVRDKLLKLASSPDKSLTKEGKIMADYADQACQPGDAFAARGVYDLLLNAPIPER